MNKYKILLCLMSFSIITIAKDEIISNLPSDEKTEEFDAKPITDKKTDSDLEATSEENIELDIESTSDEKLKKEKELIQDLKIPEKTKEIYLNEQYDAPEYPIIERFLFCLTTKWEEIGHNALEDTPGSVKELHYMVTGEICEKLQDLSKTTAGQDFYIFYDLFMNINSYPLTEYEKEQVMQSAERKYIQELAKEVLWSKIKKKTNDVQNSSTSSSKFFALS